MATPENAPSAATAPSLAPMSAPVRTAFKILCAISLCHFINDLLQFVMPAVYPILKETYKLDFGQIGFIALTNQLTACLVQPVIGWYTDRHPKPYSLAVGMASTLVGLFLLSRAPTYVAILVAVAFFGLGSAVFHPEASRMARMASGGRHGMAQSFFQVGGNAGAAVGPLLTAFIVAPYGQRSIAWFSALALTGISLLTWTGGWYKRHLATLAKARETAPAPPKLPSLRVRFALLVLFTLTFSKYVYMSSLSTYYTFYLISKFHASVRMSQICLFIFLGAVASGTMLGGVIGDRFGRKPVIWCSILGSLPFSLALPYANLPWTIALTVAVGVVMSSAFSAILVFAQELVPGRVGVISGLFFGFAFGVAGVGSAALGQVADRSGIDAVYQICSYLPAIGLLAAFLPNLKPKRAA